jgi:hypothetical protein
MLAQQRRCRWLPLLSLLWVDGARPPCYCPRPLRLAVCLLAPCWRYARLGVATQSQAPRRLSCPPTVAAVTGVLAPLCRDPPGAPALVSASAEAAAAAAAAQALLLLAATAVLALTAVTGLTALPCTVQLALTACPARRCLRCTACWQQQSWCSS